MRKFGYRFLFVALAIAFVATLSVASTPRVAAQDANTLEAMRVESGTTDPLDAMWIEVPTLSVNLTAEAEEPIFAGAIAYDFVSEATLQAVYTDDMIYIRTVWSDNTLNNNRRFWTYTENGWVRSGLNEDRLSFIFDITGNRQFNALGCGAACHTATDDMPAYMGFPSESTDAVDMWHWKATRTVGYADDQWAGAFVSEEETGRASDAKESGGYSDNANEAGDGPRFTYPEGVNPLGPLFADSALEITPEMTFEMGQTIPYYVQSRPVGSRGDIDASASYVRSEDGSGMWYVVLSRPFNTGNPEDTVFSLNSESVFGVAVFNQSSGNNHTVSEDKLVLNIGE